MKRYVVSAELLPHGFQYPASFLELLGGELPDLDPWYFLCESRKLVDGWMGDIRGLYPSRKLVPFAKWSASDDIACFDASSASQDPIVHYVHAYASPGWEDRGNVVNFLEW